jgi:hypothetical protein
MFSLQKNNFFCNKNSGDDRVYPPLDSEEYGRSQVCKEVLCGKCEVQLSKHAFMIIHKSFRDFIVLTNNSFCFHSRKTSHFPAITTDKLYFLLA